MASALAWEEASNETGFPLCADVQAVQDRMMGSRDARSEESEPVRRLSREGRVNLPLAKCSAGPMF